MVMIISILFTFIYLNINDLQPSGICGTITPYDAVKSMQLISARDTIRSFHLDGTYFKMEARPGAYRLYIETSSEYRPFTVESIIVEPGKMTEVGDLVLQKMIRKLEHAPHSYPRRR